MKNNSLKRAAALLLGVMLAAQTVSAVMPVSASDDVFAAESAETEMAVPEGLAYEISDGTVTITDYTGSATELTIPSEIEGYPVTSIGERAFEWCSSLTSVAIPSSVMSIGDEVFYNCDSLTEINVDPGNTTYSSMEGVLFNRDQTELIYCPRGKSGDYTIPSSATSIGDYAFGDCRSLTSVTIPSSVISIGNRAFENCRLTEISVDSDNTAYCSVEGVLFNKDQTELICYPSRGTSGEYTIPSSVTSIGDSAFYYCSSLTSVMIPEGVTNIGNYAFYNCDGLTSVTIPEGLTSIGYYAFSDCYGLTNVIIPEGVTIIGDYAFYDCYNLTSVIIPNGVTGIGDEAFYFCTGLTSVTISEGVTSVGSGAFRECLSLTSVTIPSSVKNIGDGAFRGCSKLTEINVDSENTAYCSVGGVLFSKDQTELLCCPGGRSGDYTIPEGITRIGNYAFYECYGLLGVIIPEGVMNIGVAAFWGCSGLTDVTVPEGVTSIGDETFYNCSGLTSMTIPEGVTSIGEYTFGKCFALTSVTIPTSVTSIEKGAFRFCSGLTSVTIPEKVTSIGNFAFDFCSSLTDVFYAGSETEWNEILIGDFNESLLNATRHFGSSTSTDAPTDMPTPTGIPTDTPTPAPNETVKPTATETPNPSETGTPAPAPETDFTAKETDSGVSVEKYIGTDATVVVPAQIAGKPVTEIGANAFADTAVKEIVLPESVTGIGEKAFANCENLETIVILGDEIEIAGDAFAGCGNLTIKCLKNSAAQQYAQEHGIACESLYYYGDVNMDGVVAAADALDILKDVVQLAPITDETARKLANIDGTEGITASDALGVLKVVVQLQEKEIYLGKD